MVEMEPLKNVKEVQILNERIANLNNSVSQATENACHSLRHLRRLSNGWKNSKEPSRS